MKCQQAEQFALLADSGELGPWGQSRLTRHRRTCAACRAFQDDLLGTRQLLAICEVPTTPPATRKAIVEAACPDRREVVNFQPNVRPITWWKPALSVAALVALLGMGWYLRSSPSTRLVAQTDAVPVQAISMDDAVDAEIASLQELLVASLNDTDEATETTLDEATMARELLALQEVTL
jgi:hypothetical protein